MYKHPGNPSDLKNYRQKAGETLCGYIRRFSRQCNELPNVANTNIVGAFLSGTTCESLVHKLGRKGPRTTKELHDTGTSHASGEEAVGAIFDRLKARQSGTRMPAKVPPTILARRRTSSSASAHSWPPPTTRGVESLPKVP